MAERYVRYPCAARNSSRATRAEAGERFENDGGLQSLKHLCPPAGALEQFIALGVHLDENPAAADIRNVTVS